jgi:hypothetical protein
MFAFPFWETLLILETSYRELGTCPNPQILIRGRNTFIGNIRVKWII